MNSKNMILKFPNLTTENRPRNRRLWHVLFHVLLTSISCIVCYVNVNETMVLSDEEMPTVSL